MAFDIELEIKRVINYLRKSRQDLERENRTGEDTLFQQEKLMHKVLTSYGIPYDTRKEIGSGDKIVSRPVFTEVLEELKTGKYNAIAVKELSRLGRGSYADMGTILDILETHRIYIITPYKIYDIHNTTDARQIRFEMFMSREEYETTRERLTGARYNLAMEGKWVAGSAPFGYEYNKRTQRLERHEEEAKVVELIFDMYVNGLDDGKGGKKQVSFRAIATFLTRAGYLTPANKKDWSYTTVKRLMSSRTYLGEVRFRTTKRVSKKDIVKRPEKEHIIVENSHVPLISVELWNKAQEKKNSPKAKGNTKLDFSPTELAGICVCSACGKKMIRHYSIQRYKKEDGTVSTYHKEFLWCRLNGCSSVKYRDVESAILKYLEGLEAFDDELLAKYVSQSLYKAPAEPDSVEDMKRQIEAKKSDLNVRLEFVYEKHESGLYDDDEFIKRRDKLKKEIEELDKIKLTKKKKDDEEEEEISVESHIETIRENIGSILDVYKRLKNKTRKNTLLREVFHHVEIELIEKGRGRRSAKFKITPILNIDILSENVLGL